METGEWKVQITPTVILRICPAPNFLRHADQNAMSIEHGQDSAAGASIPGGSVPLQNMHWGVQRVNDRPIKMERVCYSS